MYERKLKNVVQDIQKIVIQGIQKITNKYD